MPVRLSPRKTASRIKQLGIDRKDAECFAVWDDADGVTYDWHSHDRHQLLYAFAGIVRLETEHAQFLLPPHRAAWIPAGVKHATTLDRVQCGSVFFSKRFGTPGFTDVRIINASALVREMVLHSMRWQAEHDPRDPTARSFFKTLSLLCREWLQDEVGFHLPRAKSSAVEKAMTFTLENLGDAAISQAAAAAGLSERGMRRLFAAETGMQWRQFLQHARMLKAMELLTHGKWNVTQTALEVGFNSLSSFAKAFAAFCGETPASYRQRMVRVDIGAKASRSKSE